MSTAEKRLAESDPPTELRSALDRAGWRFTKQREAVFEYLRGVDDHPTAEEVYLAVRRQLENISLATVYKALDALVDAGLATKIADADGPARFDCRCEAHYHIRDLRTGKLHDLTTPYDMSLLNKLDPALVDALRGQGFHVTSYRLELQGYSEQEPRTK